MIALIDIYNNDLIFNNILIFKKLRGKFGIFYPSILYSISYVVYVFCATSGTPRYLQYILIRFVKIFNLNEHRFENILKLALESHFATMLWVLKGLCCQFFESGSDHETMVSSGVFNKCFSGTCCRRQFLPSYLKCRKILKTRLWQLLETYSKFIVKKFRQNVSHLKKIMGIFDFFELLVHLCLICLPHIYYVVI